MQFFSGKNKNTNKELIEQIILKNYNQYYRLAYSYVHTEADACDIVQNGAYKAIKNSYSLKNQEFAATWVYRIMLNECFQAVRRTKVLSYEAIQEEDGVEAGIYEDTYVDIDLQRAMEMLSLRDRTIVMLKYFEDKTLEEIADILEENVSTVKSRLYRSMKKLREMLAVEENDNLDLKGRAGR